MSSTSERTGAADDERRLAAVRRYAIVDMPPDGAFDRVTRLAARIFDVPISLISVVDRDRIWFTSHHGIDITQVNAEPDLCPVASLHDEPVVVTDTELDPRTRDYPLLRAPLGLRFYAAVPLRTADGHNLGSLSVIDTKPRELGLDELTPLEDLAAIVVDELEARLIARSNKDGLIEAKAEFVAIAAHELRTPLAALYGAAKLLEQTDIHNDETRLRLLAVIAEESEQLAAIVGEILTGAQLQAGQLALVRERCQPRELAETVLEAARPNLPDNLSLRLAVAPQLPTIKSDAARVKQILAGLLDNAIKYSPDGGQIDLAVSRENAGVRFRISDQGIGVPHGNEERIFERFVRLDPEQTRGVSGTGLGLYIARALAHQLGGTLAYDRADDGGASFVFDLPLHARTTSTSVSRPR